MYYKLFVRNLSERIFHIARREAGSREYLLRQAGLVDSTSILMLGCNDPGYISHLADTLETDSKVQVLAVKDSRDRLVDFRNIPEAPDQPFFNRHTLSLDNESRGTVYA